MKKYIKIIVCMLFVSMIFSCSSKKTEPKVYSGSVMLYSTLDEKYLIALKSAFEEEYKGVTLDYYFSTIERVSNRLKVEASTYQLEADVVWAGTVLDAEAFKESGYLEKYISEESKKIPKNLKDKEGYYAAARVAGIGIGYKGDEPKNFEDLLNEKYKDKIVMTDPNKASIYKYFVAIMMQNEKYGEEYFKKLKNNGLKLTDSARKAIESITSGDCEAGLILDYIAKDYNNGDNHIDFIYPNKDMIVMTTPVALLKDSYNPDNGKLLIDFILSYRGQKMLSDAGLISARKDVKNDFHTEKFINNIKINDIKDLSDNYDIYIEKFNNIMRG